ncbi:hypothetical protein MN116_008908 [Schistosoma mekongi]|uniref:Protein arginine N-methyltransferase 7 n=1 Tax=Schistosoma mekongi TaxID=38744 RepID=A0AAE2D1Z7_SCHME|nr:hypothetical protein MN116_008908 [Schistosoma mekongi]
MTPTSKRQNSIYVFHYPALIRVFKVLFIGFLQALLTVKLYRFPNFSIRLFHGTSRRLLLMKGERTFIPQNNPVVGRIQWKDVDQDYDFNLEIAQSGYGDVLHDSDRNYEYRLAIEHTVKLLKQCLDKPIHVLDIGTGNGLLSMMAVKAGADYVTACESFPPMAKCALRIIKNNGFSDKINVVPKRSADLVVGLDMPSKANVLVAELFGTELIGEATTFESGTAHAFILWWSLQMEPTNTIPPISVAPA